MLGLAIAIMQGQSSSFCVSEMVKRILLVKSCDQHPNNEQRCQGKRIWTFNKLFFGNKLGKTKNLILATGKRTRGKREKENVGA